MYFTNFNYENVLRDTYSIFHDSYRIFNRYILLEVVEIIWITGDTHGGWIHRLNMDSFPEQREMTKDDYVIVLGDFGIWRDSPQQRWYLNWLEERYFTTLFIDGNHECYYILDAYPVEEWHGGKVHFIKPSVIHLMRGQVFEIDD